MDGGPDPREVSTMPPTSESRGGVLLHATRPRLTASGHQQRRIDRALLMAG
jgi:hypothetical protein